MRKATLFATVLFLIVPFTALAQDPDEDCGDCVEVQCCPCIEESQEFFGPLGTINQHAPNTIFLTPLPDRALPLDRGAERINLRLDLANSVIREFDSGVAVEYDFESLRTELGYTQGLGTGEFTVAIPVVWRGPGFLDGIINNWHEFFNMRNNVRKDVPSYRSNFVIISRDGVAFKDEGEMLGIGDATVSYKLPLRAPKHGSALAARATIKLPTGDPDKALGSGSFDTGLGLLYERQVTPHLMAYLNADYIFIGKPDWDNVGHQDAPVLMAAFEYAVDRRTTALAQYRYHRNILRIGSFEADKDGQEVTFGFHRRIADGMVLTFAFGEDAHGMTAPDMQLHTGLRWDL